MQSKRAYNEGTVTDTNRCWGSVRDLLRSHSLIIEAWNWRIFELEKFHLSVELIWRPFCILFLCHLLFPRFCFAWCVLVPCSECSAIGDELSDISTFPRQKLHKCLILFPGGELFHVPMDTYKGDLYKYRGKGNSGGLSSASSYFHSFWLNKICFPQIISCFFYRHTAWIFLNFGIGGSELFWTTHIFLVLLWF